MGEETDEKPLSWGAFTLVAIAVGLIITGANRAATGPTATSPTAVGTTATSSAPSPLSTPSPRSEVLAASPETAAPGPGFTWEALQFALVPEACTHPAGRLVDGYLPGIPDNEGYVHMEPDFLAVQMVNDEPGLLTILRCSIGGVGWPMVLVLYGPDLVVRGSVDLGDMEFSAEHVDVVDWVSVGDSVHIVFVAYEGAGTDIEYWKGDLRFEGDQMVVDGAELMAGPFEVTGAPY
jgi:hypothetical protein